MPNHPNRSGRGRSRNPDPKEIQQARAAAGLDPDAAGALVHISGERWLALEAGIVRMHPGLWELFRLKVPAP